MSSPVADSSQVPSCPAHDLIPLYGPEFAANPGKVYDELRRRYGQIAPVELEPGISAMLVVGYDAALRILHDPETFPKDPRRWQGSVPPDSPLLPVMAYRPNCVYTVGAEHARLRSVVADSMARVDLYALRVEVERAADSLISRFSSAGEVELVSQYAATLPILVLNYLFGCPPSFEDRLVAGCRIVLGADYGEDSEKGNADLTQCVTELVAHKRSQPGADVISWMAAHPVGLASEELVHQVILLIAGTLEPEKSLIANALRLLLADDRFAGNLSSGSLPIEDAIDEVLWSDAPISNFGITYPRRNLDFYGVRLPADQPVVLSFAGANTDPSVHNDSRGGNRAHLAWSAGPHSCLAQEAARLIASVAIEKLLDRLPDLELAVPADELVWAPNPFFRTLERLPVRFPPVSVPLARQDNGRPEVEERPDAADRPLSVPVAARMGTRRQAKRWWTSLA
ncbi:MAG: cytochrome P450, partial [Kutzneria sp.]|nr:cytochrome P450 [Kutzneria sp.]